MSVAELLRLARQHGVDCSGCVEKDDVVALLRRRAVPAPAPAVKVAAASPPPSSTGGSSACSSSSGSSSRRAARAGGVPRPSSAYGEGAERGGGGERHLPRMGSSRAGRERQRDGAMLRVSGSSQRPGSAPPAPRESR